MRAWLILHTGKLMTTVTRVSVKIVLFSGFVLIHCTDS